MGLSLGKKKKVKEVKEEKEEVEVKKEEEQVEKEQVEKEEEQVEKEQVKDERLIMLEELFARDMKILDEQEEELNREMEDNQRKRAEIEQRRKLEEELLQRLEEFCVTKVEALKPKSTVSRNVQDISSKPKQPQKPPRETYELSRWKYSQLRDTINTSTDIELLEECRKEFQRRMTIYREWKKKNDTRSISSQKTR